MGILRDCFYCLGYELIQYIQTLHAMSLQSLMSGGSSLATVVPVSTPLCLKMLLYEIHKNGRFRIFGSSRYSFPTIEVL